MISFRNSLGVLANDARIAAAERDIVRDRQRPDAPREHAMRGLGEQARESHRIVTDEMVRQGVYLDTHGMDRRGIGRHGIDRHGIDRHGIERHGIERHGINRRGAEAHLSLAPMPAS